LPRCPDPSAPLQPVPGLPHSTSAPVAPPNVAASCLTRRTFGFCRRWSFELPLCPHPFGAVGGFRVPGFPGAMFRPLRLAVQLRVAPAIAPSGLAGDRASSCLESHVLQRHWQMACKSPRSIVRLDGAWRCRSRVAPAPASSGCAGNAAFRFPRAARPSARPLLEFAVARSLRSSGCAC